MMPYPVLLYIYLNLGASDDAVSCAIIDIFKSRS